MRPAGFSPCVAITSRHVHAPKRTRGAGLPVPNPERRTHLRSTWRPVAQLALRVVRSKKKSPWNLPGHDLACAVGAASAPTLRMTRRPPARQNSPLIPRITVCRRSLFPTASCVKARRDEEAARAESPDDNHPQRHASGVSGAGEVARAGRVAEPPVHRRRQRRAASGSVSGTASRVLARRVKPPQETQRATAPATTVVVAPPTHTVSPSRSMWTRPARPIAVPWRAT